MSIACVKFVFAVPVRNNYLPSNFNETARGTMLITGSDESVWIRSQYPWWSFLNVHLPYLTYTFKRKSLLFTNFPVPSEQNSYRGGGGLPVALIPTQFTVVTEIYYSLTIIGGSSHPHPAPCFRRPCLPFPCLYLISSEDINRGQH